MELITIKTFQNSIDAHILMSRLENEDIKCFIFDENVVTLNPLYSVAVGGIKLKINESDFERAKIVISDIEGTPFTDDNNVAKICPKCKSTDLYSGFNTIKDVKSFLAFIISFILYIFPFYLKKVYRCKQCGTEFKN